MTRDERNAQRRLNTILSDERYGPSLARLRGAQERRVLDLISENRTVEARQAILEATEARRAKRRTQAASRRAVRAIPEQRGLDPGLVARARRVMEDVVAQAQPGYGRTSQDIVEWEARVWREQYLPSTQRDLIEIAAMSWSDVIEEGRAHGRDQEYTPYMYHV
jgi:hypothetical protein